MTSSNWRCINNPNVFCNICGEYTLTQNRRLINDNLKKLYFAYFGVHMGDQDKPWAPHIVYILAENSSDNGVNEIEKVYPLPYQWCGENHWTATMIATFVWLTPKGLTVRTRKIFCTLISILPGDLYPIVLSFQCQFLRNFRFYRHVKRLMNCWILPRL